MRRNELNLAALRANDLPHAPQTRLTPDQLVTAPSAVTLSRRELLGLAGTAAVGLSPALKAVETSLLGSLEVSGDNKRVVFRLGGRDRWVIDTRRFAGSPRLQLTRGDALIRVELMDARYPGTELPADLVCELHHGAIGWRMKLRLAIGNFESQGSVERWLMGLEPARSDVLMSTAVCALGKASHLSLSGTANAEFSPSWLLKLNGPNIARLDGSAAITSNTFSISLLDGDTPSLMAQASVRRSLVALERGDNSWPLEHFLTAPEGGEITASGDPFDVIRIESGESRAGKARYALVAAGGAARLQFAPGRELRGHAGDLFKVPLRRARYAAAFDESGDHTALMADFDSQPVWLHTDGCSIEVGDDGVTPAFELSGIDGKVQQMRCEPALLRVVTPLVGALVEPVRTEAGTRISFVSGSTRLAQLPNVRNLPNILKVPKERTPQERKPPDAPPPAPTREVPTRETPARETPARLDPNRPAVVQPGLLALAAFVVSVVRPEDLLALTFRFDNLTFKTGPARLVRSSSQTAYIRVHFQGQNIAEEAFFEADPNPNVQQPQKPGDPGYEQSQKTSQTPSEPPVQARLAGPSRLVFKVPAGVNEIPFTLEALLQACTQYELSVAPTALPPPERTLIKLPVGAGIGETGRTPRVPRLERTPRIFQPQHLGVRPQRPQFVFVSDVAVLTPVQFPPVGATPAPRVPRVVPRVPPRDRVVVPDTTPPVVAPAREPDVTVVNPGGFAFAGPPKLAEPEPNQTSIEAPYRLMLSPNKFAAWLHSIKPVTHNGRTELWHTRLGVRATDGRIHEDNYEYAWDAGKGVWDVRKIGEGVDSYAYLRTLRAIWSPDYGRTAPAIGPPSPPPAHSNDPFRMSLDARDRYELVRLTADFKMTVPSTGKTFVPLPVDVDRFMLTALGAWINVRGGWDPPVPLTVEEWRHRATMGRDHYVRVVYKGYLFPFGHRASLIKVTERKFQQMPSGRLKGQTVAYLRQRMYIIVREPEKEYPAPGQPHDGRAIPFQRVRITTLVTPDLDDPGATDIDNKLQQAFWPSVGGQPFLFHLTAQDKDGQRVDFTAPLIFVDQEVAFSGTLKTVLNDVFKEYRTQNKATAINPGDATWSTRPMQGQKVAFAPSDPKKPGNTSLETQTITFDAESGTPPINIDQPPFYPVSIAAAVLIPAVKQITGKSDPAEIEYHDTYLDAGFAEAANQGKLFVQLANDVKVSFTDGAPNADKAGGLVTPNFGISGLSALTGPVGGNLDNVVQGKFDPQEYFKDLLDSQILGGITLTDILAVVEGVDNPFKDAKVPNLTTEMLINGKPVNPDAAPPQIPDELRTRFYWETSRLGKDPLGLFVPQSPKGPARLSLDAQLSTKLPKPDAPAPAAPTYKVTGLLTNFQMDLFTCIVIVFDKVEFSSKSGSKADVDPVIAEVKFGGPLEFVNSLKDYLKNMGGSGLSIDVQPTGLTVGLVIAIPTIGCGVLTIQNISLGAGLSLPFTGDPLLFKFNFCEKENPFLLTVYGIGGGGFFAIYLSLKGIQKLEAALEFGASIALDIGVASGSVSLMGGFYYKMEGDATSLTGFVRLHGEVEVLAIITVSITFEVGLTYAFDTDSLWGEASLIVEIEVLFFSTSVELKVRKEFKGGGSSSARSMDGTRLVGPIDALPKPTPDLTTTFDDMMDKDDWAVYAKAFA